MSALPAQVACPDCGGSGDRYWPSTREEPEDVEEGGCRTCKGTGKVAPEVAARWAEMERQLAEQPEYDD